MAKGFNFSIRAQATKVIGDKEGVYLEVPVYNDLLAEEYAQLEELDRLETEWTGKLVGLAQQLATKHNENLWDVVDKLSKLDSQTNEEKVEYMGEFIGDLTKLEMSKPSNQERVVRMALLLIHSRVTKDITYEEALKLPQKFLKEINDFIYAEQQGGKYTSVATLQSQLDIFEGKLALADNLVTITETLNLSDETYKQAVALYREYDAAVKKTLLAD